MESHNIGRIPVALALFSGMLAEPEFTTWENETGVAWTSFLRRIADTYMSSLTETCNRAQKFDTVINSFSASSRTNPRRACQRNAGKVAAVISSTT